MLWFWLGFFSLVAVLLFLDLGVLHRKAKEPTLKSAAWWTVGWVALGLSFTGVVYLLYSGAESGHSFIVLDKYSARSGSEAAFTYVSAYLLEQALSVDNIFVISLLFHSFRIPTKYQHRVLFWGILGAIVFRVIMLAGGAFLAHRFDWVFYVFGAYLAWQGVKLLRGGDEEGDEERGLAVRLLRRVVRVVDGDYGGRFTVIVDGRRALTTVAVCLVVIELTDVVFALDSIPAVLSVSRDTFIMITSNIFAIMGLRSLYFVLAGAMSKFRYLKIALAVLLILIGAKMILHGHVTISHQLSLGMIAGIIATGVIASLIANRRDAADASNQPPPPA
ncbi:MAG: TerC/Alx family metal homeostasis membrane protein [Kofleriaceae bacterium]